MYVTVQPDSYICHYQMATGLGWDFKEGPWSVVSHHIPMGPHPHARLETVAVAVVPRLMAFKGNIHFSIWQVYLLCIVCALGDSP